jgi:hypothetical protein
LSRWTGLGANDRGEPNEGGENGADGCQKRCRPTVVPRAEMQDHDRPPPRNGPLSKLFHEARTRPTNGAHRVRRRCSAMSAAVRGLVTFVKPAPFEAIAGFRCVTDTRRV